MEENKKIILFGAGMVGRKALRFFGPENIFCFADNDPDLAGTMVESIPVVSFPELQKIHKGYRVVISVGKLTGRLEIELQLLGAGISDFDFFYRIASNAHEPSVRTYKNTLITLNTHQKNILMIANIFPPMSGSGVQRSLSFAKYLPLYGWIPTVICADTSPQMDDTLVDEIPSGVNVVRIPDMALSAPVIAPLILLRRDELLALLRSTVRHDETAERIFDSLLEREEDALKLLEFPDHQLLWAADVICYLEQNVALDRFNAVYTTSSPYSAPLVGSYLKLTYGIPWVSDYRDPWTFYPYHPPDLNTLWGKLRSALESILFRCADRSIEVVPDLVPAYESFFHLPKGKLTCITNGYDEANFAGQPTIWHRTENFTINHSGIIYSKHRSITPILAALRELSDERKIDLSHVQFRITGDSQEDVMGAAAQYGLTDVVCYSGYVSHKEAIRANIDADLLLLLLGDDEKTKMTYPGKLFEYLRCGRPILALAPKDSAVDRLLRETGHGETYLSTQIPEIKAMLLREYRRWERGEDREPLHSPLIERYERKVLTGQLADILDQVAAKSLQ